MLLDSNIIIYGGKTAATSLRAWQRRIKLGDSLIAATALAHGLALATHNTDDFRWIPGLQLVDPLTLIQMP